MMMRRLAAALAALWLASAALAQEPASAAPEPSRAERLDTLFETLASETGPEARRAQERIAQLWSQSGSDSMDLLLDRGRAALDAEEYDKALDHLTALTELDPDFAEGWNARATAHFLKGEYWASIADIQRVLALEPRHFGALAGLGAMLEQVGEEALALRAMREAIRLNPHLDSAREAVRRLGPKIDGREI